jgi:hypothetical protein
MPIPAQCGEPVRYWNPFGGHGQVPCDLAPQHEGDHDSRQLLLRPGDTVSLSIFPEGE